MADFKILAVKILPGCSSRIRKVLYENNGTYFIRTMRLHKMENG